MRILPLLGLALAGALFAACSSTSPLSSTNPASPGQTQGAGRVGLGPNGIPGSHRSSIRGWISPDILPDRHHRVAKLLYVSDEGDGRIDIYHVPSYALKGQITTGIDQPEGIATDRHGYLYVANLSGNTVTVYKPGATSPYLTLTESNGPDDVAVGHNGYVYAGDVNGGIDVYPPGATSPTKRLTNTALSEVYGVGVDGANNVFAAYDSVVVGFVQGSGSGSNMGLTGLSGADGVFVDEDANLVVSDFSGFINFYPSGHTSPSRTISISGAERSAVNKRENLIYVPQGANDDAAVLDYSSGTVVTTIPIGNFTSGAALSPAPAP